MNHVSNLADEGINVAPLPPGLSEIS